jgi:hypothetical protein
MESFSNITHSFVISHEKAVASHNMGIEGCSKSFVNRLGYFTAELPEIRLVD